MCYHEAMMASHRGEFITAIVKEVEDYVNSNYWELVPREKVPTGTKVLDSALSTKQK